MNSSAKSTNNWNGWVSHRRIKKGSHPLNDVVQGSIADLPDGGLVVVTQNGNVLIANPGGSERARVNLPSGSPYKTAPAVAADGSIYVAGEEHRLYALNSDGSLRWEFSQGGGAKFLAGVALAFYFATEPPHGPETAAEHGDEHGEDRKLVPIPLAELAAVTVVHRGSPRQFLRDGEQRWYLHGDGHCPGHSEAQGDEHAHAANPALAERIDQAFATFAYTRVERTVDSGQQPDRFGTSNPEMIIVLHRAGETLPFRRILVGDLAPDRLARYVLLQEELTTVTIPNYQIENLEELLDALDGSVSGTLASC